MNKLITDDMVETAALAIHRSFWSGEFKEEIGTADYCARITWQNVREQRIAEARAALDTVFPTISSLLTAVRDKLGNKATTYLCHNPRSEFGKGLLEAVYIIDNFTEIGSEGS